MDNCSAAKKLIKLLDLTSLNDDDNSGRIEKLCTTAHTPYGNVAAVCVYSRFVPLAKKLLEGDSIKVATVVNFPAGGTDFKELSKEIEIAVNNGADELDIVLPYQALISEDKNSCLKFFEIINKANKKIGKTIKIIIESGILAKPSLITQACQLCMENDVNFIKTSTGKTPISATPEAANLILENISSGRRNIGFKASGGIKTLDEAKKYLILAESIMGEKWVSPQTFRIGASSLLNDLITTIERGY